MAGRTFNTNDEYRAALAEVRAQEDAARYGREMVERLFTARAETASAEREAAAAREREQKLIDMFVAALGRDSTAAY